jgi:hypothetical protein
MRTPRQMCPFPRRQNVRQVPQRHQSPIRADRIRLGRHGPTHTILIRRGVVEVDHGWQDQPIIRVTPDAVNDPISGFPLLKGVPVKIERI